MNNCRGVDHVSLSRAPVLGLPVSICNYSEVMALLRSWAENSTACHLVAAANTHVVSMAHRDEQFREAMKKFDLIVPDGMPLIWYLNRIHGAGLKDRVYGPDLMRRVLATTEAAERHFLLGGAEQERLKLEQAIAREYPQAYIVGVYSPPFGEWPAGEEENIVRLLQHAAPTFVWIGLGCPKQELLLARLKPVLPQAVYLAVGAAFSLISGTVRQAPVSWQRLGLEWAFRLLMEPRRLWQRYLVNNTHFMFFTGLEVLQKITRRPSNQIVLVLVLVLESAFTSALPAS
ncbi:MAG: WecB/TagA/CpsF family glycosyltransferase [Verrucomicrobia bacterium]|nr:WecB/TagA/CpsF family glycosyltransferase [Verrucomicrobiota bacterium]